MALNYRELPLQLMRLLVSLLDSNARVLVSRYRDRLYCIVRCPLSVVRFPVVGVPYHCGVIRLVCFGIRTFGVRHNISGCVFEVVDPGLEELESVGAIR